MPNGEQKPPTEEEELLYDALIHLVSCWAQLRATEEDEFEVQLETNEKYWIAVLRVPITDV